MKAKEATTSNQGHPYSHPSWPYILLFVAPPLAWPLSKILNISLFTTPFLTLLVGAPFIMIEYVRRGRAVEQEKQLLQDKFDAEDEAVFGTKIHSQ